MPKKKKVKKNWDCLTCEKKGFVSLQDDSDPWDVVLLVQENHIKVSPKCDNNTAKIQIK